jgi:single-stranded DNA-binding protein
MSTHVLVTGSLFRAPERRTSKAGRPFVVATLKVRDGDALQFWRITVFSESAMTELHRLREGDSLSVQGAFKAELYKPEGGEPKLSLSMVADHVLAVRQPPKERKAKGAAGPDDDIPFGGQR